MKEEGKPNWKPHYEPDQQHQVDQRRLRYDEFIATADRAFGALHVGAGKQREIAATQPSSCRPIMGKALRAASFNMMSPYQTRPVIHIPLIIRTPDQQEGRRVAFTADQTALAPTILELAGQPKPDWMPGQSLVEWLNGDSHRRGRGTGILPVSGNQQHLQATAARVGGRDRRAVPVRP